MHQGIYSKFGFNSRTFRVFFFVSEIQSSYLYYSYIALYMCFNASLLLQKYLGSQLKGEGEYLFLHMVSEFMVRVMFGCLMMGVCEIFS